ncbi:MAG: fimbiral protein pilA [Polyangiaceae bacterium]|nr:fimbiral protein pilA [Polyangiaceae bacterium]
MLNDSDKGVDAVLKGGAAVPVIGAMSALAIYGVRRYLSSAKGAEAKNTVGAIARGAVGAYEREQVSASGALKHALCQSAPPVPATVPSGTKYQADLTPGKDYDTGDDTAGWKCLKFMMTTPSYFQYEYRAGGPYKCVARGGPDPGPNGFEVSAEGDLDGDGKTSLFCQVGRVDGDKVTVGTQLFIADEGE